MEKLIPPIVVWVLLGLGACQYDQGIGFHPSTPPSASILLHKQALGHDGSFNYAFAADNGLQQGEVINPDGSRKGSYSYVDPNGKTVTLSYTAGKDGFRVLDGDHVPKAPESQQQHQHHQQFQQRPHYYQQQPPPRQNQQYVQPSRPETPRYPLFRPNPIPYDTYKNAPNAPAYRGSHGPHEGPFRNNPHPPSAPPNSQYFLEPAPREFPYRDVPHHRPAPPYHPGQYSVQEGSHEKASPYLAKQYQGNYGQDEPKRPHSFGNGYAFEFAG